MPELPDVEVFRRYFNRTALRQKIEKVEVYDTDVLDGISSRSLQMQLKGRRFTSTGRRGKYLLAGMDDEKWLVLHFGMTGFLKYFKNEKSAPDHVRVLIRFTGGCRLAYDNQRKLGRVSVVETIDDLVSKKNLGPDVLGEEFTLEYFLENCRESRASVKSLLMNQELMAGIGNIYSDEVLFRAGIHPAVSAGNLSESDAGEVYRAVGEVMRRAIEKKVDPDEFPRTCLLPHREPGASCPRCDGTIRKEQISGRSAYFCDSHQRRR